MVPDMLGSYSFLSSLEHHPDDLAPWLYHGTFPSHLEDYLDSGWLGCVLLGDGYCSRDSLYSSNLRGTREAYRSR